jgi:hypothetical protein
MHEQGRILVGGWAVRQQPPPPQNWNLKDTGFVDIMILEVLCYFHFSQNQPLKSADD